MKQDDDFPAEALNTLDLPTVGVTPEQFDNAFLLGKERCPACDGPYVVPVRYVFPLELNRRVLLRHCLDCRSFWNPPMLVGEEEPETVSSVNALGFHLDVQERNIGMARNLFAQLKEMADFSSVLEIGCGIGTALSVAASMGMKVLGYDINNQAIDKGKELYGIDLRAEHWTSESVSERYDLVLCISTLEHFSKPLPMIRELAAYARRMRSLLFISVPCIMQKHWPLLMHADPRQKTSLFRHVSGHFTHFSPEALRNACAGHGCRTRYVPPHPDPPQSWNGTLFDFRDEAERLRAWSMRDHSGRADSDADRETTLARTIQRLNGKDVYFWGCGELYQANKHRFASVNPRCILADGPTPPERSIDGLPVCRPEDVLPWTGETLPIVVFEQDANRIYQAIRERWPHFTDLVFCHEP